jgi:hypothetical protein
VAADGILIFIQLSTILQLKGVTCRPILKHNVQTKLNDTEIKGLKLKNKRQNIFGFVTIFKMFYSRNTNENFTDWFNYIRPVQINNSLVFRRNGN